jgi:hypothetical protein
MRKLTGNRRAGRKRYVEKQQSLGTFRKRSHRLAQACRLEAPGNIGVVEALEDGAIS